MCFGLQFEGTIHHEQEGAALGLWLMWQKWQALCSHSFEPGKQTKVNFQGGPPHLETHFF